MCSNLCNTVFLFLENVYLKYAVENIRSTNAPTVVAENPLDKLDCKKGKVIILKKLTITPFQFVAKNFQMELMN